MKQPMKQQEMGGRVRRYGLALGGATVIASASSCATPWEKPQPVGEVVPGLNVAVVQEAITTPAQGVYVVTQVGTDGYCDDALYAGNHAGAIQACINKANTDGGGIILLRAGTYSSGTWPISLSSGVTLKSDGHLAARITASGTYAIDPVADYSAIEGINFSLFYVTQGAVHFSTSSTTSHREVRIEHNFFSTSAPFTSTRYGISGGGASYQGIIIRSNVFSGAGSGPLGSSGPFNAIDLTAASGTGSPFDRVRIQDNDFSFAATGTIRLNGTTTGLGSMGAVISGNVLRSSPSSLYGFELTGLGTSVIANNYVTGFNTPIKVTDGGATQCAPMVTGNFLRTGTVSASGSCIANLIVAGNSQATSYVKTGRVGVLVRAHTTGLPNQTFTAGTPVRLTFTDKTVDYGPQFGDSTFTAHVPGWYRIHACARFATANFGTGDWSEVSIVAAGTTYGSNRVLYAEGDSSFSNCTEDIVQLALSDTAFATVNAGGARNARTVLSGPEVTFITIERVSD